MNQDNQVNRWTQFINSQQLVDRPLTTSKENMKWSNNLLCVLLIYDFQID